MTTLARLDAIHDAAWRNQQPDVCAAVKLLRADVAALEADAARLREDAKRLDRLDDLLDEAIAFDPMRLFVEDGGVILAPSRQYAHEHGLTEVFVGDSLRSVLDAALKP